VIVMELQILEDSQVIERMVGELFSQPGVCFTPAEIQDIFRAHGFRVRLDEIRRAMIRLSWQGRVWLDANEWSDEIKRLMGGDAPAVQRRRSGARRTHVIRRRSAKGRPKGPA